MNNQTIVIACVIAVIVVIIVIWYYAEQPKIMPIKVIPVDKQGMLNIGILSENGKGKYSMMINLDSGLIKIYKASDEGMILLDEHVLKQQEMRMAKEICAEFVRSVPQSDPTPKYYIEYIVGNKVIPYMGDLKSFPEPIMMDVMHLVNKIPQEEFYASYY